MNTIKKVLVAATLAFASVALPGCDTLNTVTQGPVLANTTVDEKALYVAETAFSAATSAIEQGVDSGLIKGQTAAAVDGYYTQAYSALLLARKAQAAGDSGTLLEQAVLVQELVAKIFAAVKK